MRHKLSEDVPEDNIIRFNLMPKKDSKNNELGNKDTGTSNHYESRNIDDLNRTITLNSDSQYNKYNFGSNDVSVLEEESQTGINVFNDFIQNQSKLQLSKV